MKKDDLQDLQDEEILDLLNSEDLKPQDAFEIADFYLTGDESRPSLRVKLLREGYYFLHLGKRSLHKNKKTVIVTDTDGYVLKSKQVYPILKSYKSEDADDDLMWKKYMKLKWTKESEVLRGEQWQKIRSLFMDKNYEGVDEEIELQFQSWEGDKRPELVAEIINMNS